MNTLVFHCSLTAAVLSSFTPVALGASGTWTQTASGGLWSNTANWSGGTVADGSGSTANFSTIDITADNTVKLDAARTLTALTFNDTTSGNGWVLDNNGNAANILTLAGTTPSITVSPLAAGKTVTISAVIAGTTGWSKLGAGTLILSGVNTYDAPTTIDSVTGVAASVTLSVNSINSIGAGSGSALGQPTTAANGQINLGRNGALVYTGAAASSDRNFNLFALGGNAAINNSGTGLLTLSGTIGTTGTPAALVLRGAQNITANGQLTLGAANLLKVDAGTVTLSNPLNTFSGFVHVQGGTLSVNSIAAGGVASAIGNGTQIQLGNTTTGGTLVYTGTGDTTNRTLTLAGTTGGATLDQSGTGLLKFTSDSTVTANGAKTLTFQGSTTGTGEFAGKIVDSGSGATSVTKNGTGTWTLSGANTHSGPVIINGGTLILSGVNTYNAPTTIATSAATTTLSVNSINSVGALSGSALGQPTTAANGQINIGRNGLLSYTGGTASSDRNFNLAATGGNAAIGNSGGAGSVLTLSGTITGSATNLVLRGTRDVTVSGQLTLGTAGLLKAEAGTVTLSNPLNAFSGAAQIQNGTLSVNSIAAGGVASAIGTGTQIQIGNTTTGGKLVYTGTGDTTNRTLTLAGTTGGATLDQSGTGLLKFTSDSTVTANGAKTLTLQGSTAGTGEFAGKIVDSGSGATSVAKNGTGTWTLSGANTYTGNTSISAGTLAVGSGGSIASTSQIIVAANTTLDVSAVSFTLGASTAQILSGNGTVTGGITVGANGTLAIGSSAGTMNFAGDLGMEGSSISNFEINDFTVGNYDLAKAAAAGTQAVAFNGGILNLFFQSGFSTTGSVTIFDFDAYTGAGFTSVVSTGLASGYTASFDATNGMVTVVPEPGSALLGGLGMLALLSRRRA